MFKKNYDKIKKNWSAFDQNYRFCYLFFINEDALSMNNKVFKFQKEMLNEISTNARLLMSKGIEKKISTYFNEISYTQAKTIDSK